jgi:hypothetical protein
MCGTKKARLLLYINKKLINGRDAEAKRKTLKGTYYHPSPSM